MANILSCPIPDNINPLSPNGFNFAIQKLPQMSYFCQQVNLPGIILGEPTIANPFTTQPIPGEHITYDQLNVQFLVDEQMANYKAIYNWIIALGFPNDYEQYTTFVNEDQRGLTSELAKNYSTGTMQILGNTNNVVRTVTFNDLFPVSISTLDFQSTNQDVLYGRGRSSYA